MNKYVCLTSIDTLDQEFFILSLRLLQSVVHHPLRVH